jgi:hypothetical protein
MQSCNPDHFGRIGIYSRIGETALESKLGWLYLYSHDAAETELGILLDYHVPVPR